MQDMLQNVQDMLLAKIYYRFCRYSLGVHR